MKSLIYALSGLFVFLIGVIASLLVFDYSLYEEYKLLYNVALHSKEKDWLMRAMVEEPRNAFLINAFKSVFIFLSCFVIMILLLKKSSKTSNERSAEQ